MLTAEHVRARRKSGELIVRPLDLRERARAQELAEAYLDVARACVGRTRDELEDAWSAAPVAPREKRVADQAPVDPIELRRAIFSAASAARSGAADARVDRAAVLEAAALENGISATELERSLYADLRGAQILLSVGPLRAAALVDRYDRGQVQAVLLRAVRVIADVSCAAPAAYRALFRELKFRRLLYRIERRGAGYRIEIDGPFSLFDSVTRYGLSLALVLPALESCDSLALVAEVRWGKQREPLVFRHLRAAGSEPGAVREASAGPRVRDDVAVLLAAFAELDTPWRASECTEILDFPGIGVCVPDLVFERAGTRERVYFEALGFWSRDAVWKRVDLVKQGLAEPILFAVSSRLRVSEAVLDDVETAALYVYKGVMSARSVERKLEGISGR